MSFVSFFEKTANRLKSAIYAKPIEDPSKPHLRVGLIGGEIPVFPPLAMLMLTGLGVLGWKISDNRMRFLPSPIGASMQGRAAIALAGFFGAFKMAGACQEALKSVGTTPDFQPVKQVADTGPFAISRNMMYVSLISMPASFSIAFDTAWLCLSTLGLAVYLDRVVVPAEEKFLTEEIGEKYLDYCKKVPRWFKLF